MVSRPAAPRAGGGAGSGRNRRGMPRGGIARRGDGTDSADGSGTRAERAAFGLVPCGHGNRRPPPSRRKASGKPFQPWWRRSPRGYLDAGERGGEADVGRRSCRNARGVGARRSRRRTRPLYLRRAGRGAYKSAAADIADYKSYNSYKFFP